MSASSTTPPINRRATRKKNRHDAIIQVARRSFFEDGYAATSMSGLLTTLGGSKETLWGHFRSKEELFAAVIGDATSVFRDELESELLEGTNLEETLVAFCRGVMSKMFHPDGIGTWRLIAAESRRFPELGRIFYEKVAQRIENKLADYFRKQIQEGRLGYEEPERMAEFLIAICSTRHNLGLFGLVSDDIERINRDAERFARYFLTLFSTEQSGPQDAGSAVRKLGS